MIRFREIYEVWRKDSFLRLALNDFYVMFEASEQMFVDARRSLRGPAIAIPAIDIYQRDKRVNALQIDVRRRVLQHLSIVGPVNLIPGVVLLSVVVDLERIGDYAKNIVELATAYSGELDCGVFEQDVRKIEAMVVRLFSETRPIIEISDQQSARRLISECERLRKVVDDITAAIIQQQEASLTQGQSAVIALYVRYLKRTGAHLLNILSSVVNPFERIGYRENDV